jgi:isopenicillin N synthase-like dioxygenase
VLQFIGLNESQGIAPQGLQGYGRMLHYHHQDEATLANPNWCGAHFDHGVFTGLVPAYYFKEGVEVEEPEEAGLYILPTRGQNFEKIKADDKNVLLFQVGEFAQLATHDEIRATQHLVKKAKDKIERFTFALFYSAANEAVIYSRSELRHDGRYSENQCAQGGISYDQWQKASYARYRAS